MEGEGLEGGGGGFAVFVDPIHTTFGSFITSGTGPAGGGGAGGGGGSAVPVDPIHNTFRSFITSGSQV